MGSRRTCDEALEERLVGEIFIVLLEVLFRRRDELDCCKLVTGNRVSLDHVSGEEGLRRSSLTHASQSER